MNKIIASIRRAVADLNAGNRSISDVRVGNHQR
jgi:hypothetical protein